MVTVRPGKQYFTKGIHKDSHRRSDMGLSFFVGLRIFPTKTVCYEIVAIICRILQEWKFEVKFAVEQKSLPCQIDPRA